MGWVTRFLAAVALNRSDILAGDIWIKIGRSQFTQPIDLPQVGSSPMFLHRLGCRSMGHLHRRHHHVQVRPFPL